MSTSCYERNFILYQNFVSPPSTSIYEQGGKVCQEKYVLLRDKSTYFYIGKVRTFTTQRYVPFPSKSTHSYF